MAVSCPPESRTNGVWTPLPSPSVRGEAHRKSNPRASARINREPASQYPQENGEECMEGYSCGQERRAHRMERTPAGPEYTPHRMGARGGEGGELRADGSHHICLTENQNPMADTKRRKSIRRCVRCPVGLAPFVAGCPAGGRFGHLETVSAPCPSADKSGGPGDSWTRKSPQPSRGRATLHPPMPWPPVSSRRSPRMPSGPSPKSPLSRRSVCPAHLPCRR